MVHPTNRDKKIEEIIFIIKLGSLFALSLIELKRLYVSDIIYSNYNLMINFIITLFCFTAVMIFYYFWSTVIINKLYPKYKAAFLAIESILFLLLFMNVILTTGKYESPYKILFLFIIIPASLQYGFKLGIASSFVSVLFIFAVDIIYGSKDAINVYLENDIIISSVYIVIAWFLSYYVKLEKEHATMLENKATIDSLTGLYNHRYFHDALKDIFESGELESDDISLIFLDIDHFKEYNDMFGHLRGDNVLRDIGSSLKDIVINRDGVVCRYGGDEFAIIIRQKKQKQVVELAEKIRKTIEGMDFEGQEHLPSKNITTSIGIAFHNKDMKDYLEIIKSADDALYRAKFINKNKVEVYSSVFDMIRSDVEEDQFALLTSIKTLISVINAKDKYTYGHVERVVTYTKMFADEIMLSDHDKKTLIYSAYMHDIGKINIPEVVLNKKMPLNREEWDIIKQHPQNGAEIVKKVESLSDTAPIIEHHHERYDGTGYPEGLKEDDIPYLSRILSIVDSFDAMTFSRPYRPAMTFSQALNELQECSGKQFDPHLTRLFVKTIRNINKGTDSYVPNNKDRYIK